MYVEKVSDNRVLNIIDLYWVSQYNSMLDIMILQRL